MRRATGPGQRSRQYSAAPLLAALLWPGVILADSTDLATARQLYEEMQYERSERAFRAALAAGGNRPAELADIYLHLGIIAASTNRKRQAIDDFMSLLCIDPEPTIGEELPPKIQRRLDEARRRAAKITRFEVGHDPVRTLSKDGGLLVTAKVTPDSLGMARGLTLRYRSAGQRAYRSVARELAASVTFELSPTEVPPGKDVEYFLQLTDQHGSALHEVGTELAPLRAHAPGPPPVAASGSVGAGRERPAGGADQEASLLAQPWFLITAGAGALALIAGGTTAAVVAWVVSEPREAHFGQVGQEIAPAQ
ncbi:MAG: hypothetical protein JXR83_13685 [Deltaproteobacteria bacterium]|nr:hypothetical protein [Deltaproteobacteria bacterium]